MSLQPYVTCEPDIETRLLTEDDDYLVLASDGVWDVLSNEDVAKIVRAGVTRGFLHVAKQLCGEAILSGSSDNVTALVVDLK